MSTVSDASKETTEPKPPFHNNKHTTQNDNVKQFVEYNRYTRCFYGIVENGHTPGGHYSESITYRHIEPVTRTRLTKDVIEIFTIIHTSISQSLMENIYIGDVLNIVMEYCHIGQIFFANIDDLVGILMSKMQTCKLYYLLNDKKCETLYHRIKDLRKRRKRDETLEKEYISLHPKGTICKNIIKGLLKNKSV